MVSEDNEPADLTGFLARREELKRERRRKKARDTTELPSTIVAHVGSQTRLHLAAR